MHHTSVEIKQVNVIALPYAHGPHGVRLGSSYQLSLKALGLSLLVTKKHERLSGAVGSGVGHPNIFAASDSKNQIIPGSSPRMRTRSSEAGTLACTNGLKTPGVPQPEPSTFWLRTKSEADKLTQCQRVRAASRFRIRKACRIPLR